MRREKCRTRDQKCGGRHTEKKSPRAAQTSGARAEECAYPRAQQRRVIIAVINRKERQHEERRRCEHLVPARCAPESAKSCESEHRCDSESDPIRNLSVVLEVQHDYLKVQ